MHLVFAKEVAHGEVGELDTHTSDDTCLSPTQRELQLVVGLLFQFPVDIDGAVIVVRLDIGVDLFRVEEAHRGDFTCRTLDGVLREEVARLGAQLTAYDLLVETVVTIDAYVADVCLRSFLDAHLEVDGVANDVDFRGFEVVEQVTIVPIVVTYGVLVLRKAFLHLFLIVDVAFLHAQRTVEIVAGDDGVTHPRDITQVVALAFVNLDEDVDVVLVDGPHGVFQNSCVTIAQFVIFIDECLLGLLITFGGVLLGLEDVAELAGLVDFTKGTLLEQVTLDFLVGELVVAFENNLADLHLRFLVDVDIEDDLILAGDVVALDNLDFGIVIALVVEVFLGQDLRTVNHVGRNL